ncbi:biogenesis of lysosome-related organelles complex 1 subunit 5 isoform X2 [Rhinatrema bivittatum]|uniref:biogenesis of lysosome-related organelles complex 1 subunit 5 isoform X2 n=1 Tax=Rhinatrema bivittatum TaxID=194408 RepID=UPI001125EE45|nr:biogenesis of lysosome-related organelles complex 1 subunit 5 isoform X2 [Rhinatrema bivittatum]
MSGGGGVVSARAAGSPLHSLRRRDTPAPAATSAQLIIKDLGEIHSRLLDHRPFIQGEARYFIKEFEEKRRHRELKVLEKLESLVSETNHQTVPSCQEAMHDSLCRALQTLETANHTVRRLQQREQKETEFSGSKFKTSEMKNRAQRDIFMKEQERCQAEIDEEHGKAMEHLKEQYTEMEKELSKSVSF